MAGPSIDDPSSSEAKIGETSSLEPTGPYSIGLIGNSLDLDDDEVSEQILTTATNIEEEPGHSVDPVTVDFADVDFAFSSMIGAEFTWLIRQNFAIRGQGTQYNHELQRVLADTTFNAHIAE
jgi:hypothetical protein